MDFVTYVTDIFGNKTYTIDKSTFYYHMNWGWAGSYNGYFIADAFEIKDNNGNLKYDFSLWLQFWVVTQL